MASAAEEAPGRMEWPTYAKPGGAKMAHCLSPCATQADMDAVVGGASEGNWKRKADDGPRRARA
eukprot:scaffold157255_cov23-Tisochrysis_lutea.AAC.1